MGDGLDGGEGTVATRPERRPRDQDRRGAARCRPIFPFGIGTKAVNRSFVSVRTLPYLTTPVSPFHAEPLHLVGDRRDHVHAEPTPGHDQLRGRPRPRIAPTMLAR